MENLLVNLRKYRPRENTDPLENFVTETFAWLLKSSDEVRDSVLSCINEFLDTAVELPKGDCEISTQENFSNKYPDLVVAWPECTWVFEHKVWSNLHKNQLKNYREYIESCTDDHRIILITAKAYQHGQNPDAALCWQDIYKCLSKLEQTLNDEKLSWAIGDFLTLLKTEGLGPSTPINSFSMKHYLEAVKFDNQVDSVFQAAKHKSWPLQSRILAPEIKRQKTETRVGLEFCPVIGEYGRRWLPGVFFGVILDGYDHGVTEFLNDELNLCIVFDFNRTGQTHIKNSSTYQSFKTKLQSLVNSEFKQWEFIDTVKEPKAKANKWHPIVMLCPMLNVFEHTTSHDQQVETVHKLMGCFQEKLIGISEFKQLVDELAQIKEAE
jgi:hypothetical protein